MTVEGMSLEDGVRWHMASGCSREDAEDLAQLDNPMWCGTGLADDLSEEDVARLLGLAGSGAVGRAYPKSGTKGMISLTVPGQTATVRSKLRHTSEGKTLDLPKLLSQATAARLLANNGWTQELGGKHVVKMTKPGQRPITLPHHKGQDYSRGLTRAILKQAGLLPQAGE